MGPVLQKADTKATPFTQQGTKAINIPPERSQSIQPIEIIQPKPIKPKPIIYCRIRCPQHFGKILALRDRNDFQVCLKCGRYLRTFKCQSCSFEICLECYNEPKEYFRCYCNEGHQLIFQGNLGNHICDMCDVKIDSAYACRECDIDLCLKCKKQLIDKFSAESQKCANVHNKRALIYIYKEEKCTQCKADCDGYWFCKTCNILRCLDCKSEQEVNFMKTQFQIK